MTDYVNEFKEIITNVTRDLGHEVELSQIKILDRGVPHVPSTWLDGYMAVYTYNFNEHFLKIGKAGPRSKARFTNQHYNPNSAPSTLAASILNDPEMSMYQLDENTVGDWIKNNCRRIDIMIPVDMGIFLLELIEAALHYKYEPKYEGFSSQR